MRRFSVFLILLCMLVTGCEGITISIDTPTQPPATRPRATPGGQPAITPVPATAGASSPAMPARLPSAKVSRVVDGDTVHVLLNGKDETLRLIGINTAETVDPRRPVECFGKEASNQAKAMLSNQTVYLESDPSQQERDRYGRLLRYIWLPGGRLFNLELIAQGYAYEYTYDTPYKYQKQFKQAQQQAQSRQIGLWSPQTCSGQK
jgi:micrococcal nuclease